MLITRNETWGDLIYNTKDHFFSCINGRDITETPYITQPIVLNCDLTFKCNMDCKYCVAKDLANVFGDDLNVTDPLIHNINKSPFMVIVITGGEPFIEDCQHPLLHLLDGLRDKGIIIDTNGTIFPSTTVIDRLVKSNVLVRISLDSPRPQDEWSARMPPGRESPKAAYEKKLTNIVKFIEHDVQVAIQSVLHGVNRVSIREMPKVLNKWNITQWYIQRFIPSYKLKNPSKFFMGIREYEKTLQEIKEISARFGIQCITKKDRRHNCVFLLVGEGDLFTQGELPGQKLRLGKIGEIENYFEFVSASEHSMRYYEITE